MAESCHNLVTTLGVTTKMVSIVSICGHFDPISTKSNVFAIATCANVVAVCTFNLVAVIAGGHLVIIVTCQFGMGPLSDTWISKGGWPRTRIGKKCRQRRGWSIARKWRRCNAVFWKLKDLMRELMEREAIMQGVFYCYPSKNLKYGKPRLGVL